MNNITAAIDAKRPLKLHNKANHPVCLFKTIIQEYFAGYACYDHLPEVVSMEQNFDSLLFPPDHPARLPTDTYYMDRGHVLRTHTSAHQNELLRVGEERFLVTGDVYRRDTVDRTHYPVFHQMEGVKLLPEGSDALADLKNELEGLIRHLFPGRAYRFLDDDFPFTTPSIQTEVWYADSWVEVLGAGVIHPRILQNCGISGTGWAFGLGIDRLLLTYCGIPDIRYLWTEDPRFLDQFENGLTQFLPYSKYPPVKKDISFWVDQYAENHESMWSQHNDFCELVREEGRDLIEEVCLVDKFRKADRVSLMYRIVYCSHDRTLSNLEINRIQERIRVLSGRSLDIELR